MNKTMSLLLVLAILCASMFPCALAETRASDYFTSYGTSCSAVGNGQLYITFKALGTTICDQLGVASYEVERLDENGNWNNVSGLLSGQSGSNVSTYVFGRYFQGVAGETYRLQVTFYCTIGSSTEHKYYTSGRVTAR